VRRRFATGGSVAFGQILQSGAELLQGRFEGVYFLRLAIDHIVELRNGLFEKGLAAFKFYAGFVHVA